MLPQNSHKPGNLVRWEKDNEPTITHYLREWLAILKPTDAGTQILDPIRQEKFAKILADKISIDQVEADEDKNDFIQRAVLQLVKSIDQDINAFRGILASDVWNYKKHAVEQFRIIFPLHISPVNFQQIKRLRILDLNLFVRDWAYVRRHFQVEPFLNRAEQEFQFRTLDANRADKYMLQLRTNFTPLVIAVEGRSMNEAFNKANRAYDLLRALLNRYTTFGRYRIDYGPPSSRPLGPILSAPLYGVFKPNGDYVEIFINTLIYEDYSAINSIEDEQIDQARRLSQQLGSPIDRHSTNSILVEALEKYGQALDTAEWRLAFLTFWQILELITLQTENLKMQDVLNRTNTLLQQHKISYDLLTALVKTRNKLVHQGHFPDLQGVKEVNLLKSVVESAINILYNRLDDLPTTRKLALFYEYAPKSDVEILDRQDVLNYILHGRKSKKP